MSNSSNKIKPLEHVIKYQRTYLTALLLLILIIPFATQLSDHPAHVQLTQDAYFHLRSAEQINWTNFYQNPFHLLLATNFTRTQPIYQLFPPILGLLSLLLLGNVLKKLNLTPQNRFFFTLFLILSPPFIYLFTTLNHHAFTIFLILGGFNLLYNKKKPFNYLALPVFALITFLDIFSAFLATALLGIYFYLEKKPTLRMKPAITFLAISTLLNLALKKPFLLGPYFHQNFTGRLLADLGGSFGFGIFALLLAIFGLAATWKKKQTHLIYPFLIIFLITAIFRNSILMYLNFPLVYFASTGFIYIYKKDWKLDVVKNIFIFLLILGLLFSTLTQLNASLPAQLNPELKESLQDLDSHTANDQLIFSHPQDSYVLEYFSNRPAFIHYHDSNFETKNQIAQQIFQSTYIRDTFPLLEENQLEYIYLSPKTKANLPSDQGLLFVFQNERFKRIYSQENTEIWRFQ